jgi:hypothetical protein
MRDGIKERVTPSLTSISPSCPLPTSHQPIESISLLPQTLIFPLDIKLPAFAILCPKFSSHSTASSSSLSLISDNATNPSVDEDNNSREGVGGWEEGGRKRDVEGRRERWVMSSEWVEEWV